MMETNSPENLPCVTPSVVEGQNENSHGSTTLTMTHVYQRECADILDPRRILWTPTPEQIVASNITAFMDYLKNEWSIHIPDYDAFLRWSIEYPEEFWIAWLWFSGIIYEGDDTEVLVQGDRMIDARWFPDVRLNFAENLLRHAKESPDKEAIVFWGEDRIEEHLTYAQLAACTAEFGRLFDRHNIQKGDRIAALIPNIPAAVAAMLATTARGAIWSSVSPEFGTDAVVNRFEQLEPKLLIAADGHLYRGKTHNALSKVQEIVARIPSIQHTVIVPYLWPDPDFDFDTLPNTTVFQPPRDAKLGDTLTYKRLPFNHPVYILFSSGTTGKPKCIMHGAGGTLLNHYKEHRLHTDLKKEDTIFYFSTTNWMMWNWLVSALGTGSKIVLYDGDPMLRNGNILFDLADKEHITVFGTSAKFLSAIERQGVQPRTSHSLASIRTILSTGSVLHGPQFDYVYRHVHPTAQLASISGGTDIIGGFAVGNPVCPVHREELQTRSLGYKVEVFDERGSPVPRGVRGELVCTAPFPSQPVGFWNDPNDERYLKSYFEKYGPTVWHHGDYAERTASGGMVIHGRSDATLNPGGVRIGTAEIYEQLEKIPEVAESVAVGQKMDQDERIVLFVVLKEGHELTDVLKQRIRTQIRSGTSPRHVPAVILAAPALPYTRNGKLAELAVKAALHGEEIKNADALANPESLEYFKNLL